MFDVYVRMHFLEPFPPKFLGTPSLNGVSLICVIFTTFNFNCYMVMDSLHSFIANVHSTMALSSSSINTSTNPIWRLLVLPFKWLDREVNGIPHDLHAFHKEWVPISTTSIASSWAWLVHVNLFFLGGCFSWFGIVCVLCLMQVLFVAFLL